MGIYSSLQAAGGALGPFLGGVAADTSWRMAYLGTALLALCLIVLLPPQPRLSDAPRVDIRRLLTRRMSIIGFSAFFFGAGPYAGSVLIGLKARDLLGLAASDAGLIIFASSQHQPKRRLVTIDGLPLLRPRAWPGVLGAGVVSVGCLVLRWRGSVWVAWAPCRSRA